MCNGIGNVQLLHTVHTTLASVQHVNGKPSHTQWEVQRGSNLENQQLATKNWWCSMWFIFKLESWPGPMAAREWEVQSSSLGAPHGQLQLTYTAQLHSINFQQVQTASHASSYFTTTLLGPKTTTCPASITFQLKTSHGSTTHTPSYRHKELELIHSSNSRATTLN